MRRDHLDHPLSKPLTLRLRKNENVRQISERRTVGNNSREAELFLAVINSEWERVCNRTLDRLARDPFRPIRRCQVIVDCGHVDPFRIAADRKAVAGPFTDQNDLLRTTVFSGPTSAAEPPTISYVYPLVSDHHDRRLRIPL